MILNFNLWAFGSRVTEGLFDAWAGFDDCCEAGIAGLRVGVREEDPSQARRSRQFDRPEDARAPSVARSFSYRWARLPWAASGDRLRIRRLPCAIDPFASDRRLRVRFYRPSARHRQWHEP